MIWCSFVVGGIFFLNNFPGGFIMLALNNELTNDDGFLEELSRYQNEVSIYPTNRRNKYGISVPSGYGIAFYYEDLSGKKMRKVFTGKDKDSLPQKRVEFLKDLYQKKMKAQQTEPMSCMAPAVSPVYTVPVPIVQPVSCTITVEKAVDDFMKFYKPTVSYQTYLGEMTNANHIKRILGTKLVAEITFNDFQHLVNVISAGRNGKPAAPKTVLNIMISFKRIMRYCRKQKWLSRDDLELITTDIRIPTFVTDNNHEAEVKESKFLDYAGAGEILHVLETNQRYYLTARILFLTGLRPQEFFGLKKSDLHPEGQYIEIKNAMVVQEQRKTGDRKFEIGTTKNKYSIRKVPATREVFQFFDKLEKLMKSTGCRQKSYEHGNENMVIVDKNGNLMDVHSFGENLNRYIQRKAPGKKFTLNMPRHCYQDYLDMLGAKDSDVEKAVGHTLGKVSERYYKVNDAYLTRLIPYLDEMGKNIESAYQKYQK